MLEKPRLQALAAMDPPGWGRGLLVLGLLLLGEPALETVLARALDLPLLFDHPRYLPKAILVHGAHLVFVLSVLRYGAGMRFRPLFATWPTPRQALPWLLAAVAIGLPPFIAQFGSGHRLDSARFCVMAAFLIATYGALLPFMEELTYRVLAFSLFLRGGRLCAYLGSTGLFALSHFVPLEQNILQANAFVITYHVTALLLFGFLSARALEVTRTWTTCLLMHSCVNLMPEMGLILGAAWRTFG
ncbi:MAG: CPBP family intramembrane glutamic endopeptidase [Candidatus Latescibacterota bacterium]